MPLTHQYTPIRLLYSDGIVARTCAKIWRQRYNEAWPSQMPKYGCEIHDGKGDNAVIVYTYDTPLNAFLQGRGYDRDMESNSLIHEQAHLKGWAPNHPGALPTRPYCGE